MARQTPHIALQRFQQMKTMIPLGIRSSGAISPPLTTAAHSYQVIHPLPVVITGLPPDNTSSR